MSYYWVGTQSDARISASVNNLSAGTHTVQAYAIDKLGEGISKSWSFKIYAQPTIEQLTPGDGAVTKQTPSVISAKFSNTFIDPASIALTVDGVKQTHTYNSSTGVVSWAPTTTYPNDINLVHNVKLEAIDIKGVYISKSWSFKVFNDDPVAPRITNLTPANGSTAFNYATMSATIADYNGINATSFTLTANGSIIPCNFTPINPYSGTVTASLNGLPEGTYTLNLSVADTLGNPATATWTFIFDKCIIASYVRPTGGVSLSSNFNINVHWEDKLNHNMSTSYRYIEVIYPNGTKTTYDGTTSPAVYAYNSWWSDEYNYEIYYNQLEEGINLNLTQPGNYTVTAKAKDVLGNENTKTWTFNAGIPPTISEQYPADRANFVETSPSVISAKVSDVDGIDPNSIKLYFMDSLKSHTYDPVTGIVSWNCGNLPPMATNDWPRRIKLEVKDIYGVPASSEWFFTITNVPPTVDQLTPANGAAFETTPSVISARVSDPYGIDANSIKLTVAGVTRTHSYDPFTGIVSWVPEAPFPQSSAPYPVKLEVKDSYGKTAVADWSFLVYHGPELTASSPRGDTYEYSPLISASFSDPFGLKQPAELKLDGQIVSTNIVYATIDQDNGCDVEEIPDYTRGTISAGTSVLPDGEHTVEVKITNGLGFTTTQSWTFTVKVPPQFRDYPPNDKYNTYPPHLNRTNNNRSVSFRVFDPNGNLDPNSIIVFGYNGVGLMQVNYDPATGIVIATSLTPIPDFDVSFSVQASDTAGNTNHLNFSIYVMTEKPQYFFKGEGQTFSADEPLDISVDMKTWYSFIKQESCSLKIDGNPVTANVSVDNEWHVGFGFELWHRAAGTFKYQGSLTAGEHELTATATTEDGNTNTQSWKFKVGTTFFSNLKPQGNVISKAPTVEATLHPVDAAIKQETIKLTIDNKKVEPVVTEVNGSLKVSYPSASLADDKNHEVNLSVTDANNVHHSRSWKFFGAYQADSIGLSLPNPVAGGINHAGLEPVTVHVNNSDGTMDLANTAISFTNLTTNETFQGVTQLLGSGPQQKLRGWYEIAAQSIADGCNIIDIPQSKPGMGDPLPDGNWSVTVTVPNKANPGAPYTLNWQFTVGQKPVIEKSSPSGTTVSKKPTVVVKFSKGTDLRNYGAELYLDGQKLPSQKIVSVNSPQVGTASIYLAPPTIVYEPAADLTEGLHKVLVKYLNVTTGEVITSKEWTFTVQTTGLGPSNGVMDIGETMYYDGSRWYPKYPEYSNYNGPCWGCHGEVQKIPKAGILNPLVTNQSGGGGTCAACHGEVITDFELQSTGEIWRYKDPKQEYNAISHPDIRVDCSRCHNSEDLADSSTTEDIMTQHPEDVPCAQCHMADGSVKMIPNVLNNRMMNRCTACHYEADQIKATPNHDGAPELSVSGKINHNIEDGHLSDTTGCTSCHSRVLTREHASTGRTDKQGNPINCNTCHAPNKTENLAISDMKIRLTDSNQIIQKTYYPPKGKRITSFISWVDEEGWIGSTAHIYPQSILNVYALVNGEWVIWRSYVGSYWDEFKCKTWDISSGADAIMLYGQIRRNGYGGGSNTLEYPVTLELTQVTLTTTASDKVLASVLDGNSKCDGCHTVAHTANHTSTPDTFCLTCHKDNLVSEHMDNPKTQSGNNYTCDTCHKDNDRKLNPASPNTIKDAITNHLRNCSDCHGPVDHDKQHEFDLGSECRTCHKLALTKEHISNPDTQTKTNDCATCHNSTGNKVVRSIQNNSLYCGGCHQVDTDNDGRGHKNVVFADKVPADIPLYTGFEWSAPTEASLFAGEPTTPAGYKDGQIVFSNRRDVPLTDIWTYYETQLKAKDWKLESTPPEADATSFNVEFSKEGRNVTVRCFKTLHNDLTGATQDGYRIEIWYTHNKTN